MKNLSRILWGIVLVLLGVIWGLNKTGITNIDIFFDGWWTLFIIVPSFISLLSKKDNKLSSFICLIVGILLLLASLNVFDFEIIWELFFPFVVVLIGLSLIFGKKTDPILNEKIKVLDKDGLEQITGIFAASDITKSGEKFESALINAVFGAVKLDLRDALLEEETVIGASAIFGGIEIYVPEDCVVKVKSTPIFGGVSNDRKSTQEPKKTIYIDALAVFGGIDIK